jgi:peptidyl-prolyl cis-trans isomerase SurA
MIKKILSYSLINIFFFLFLSTNIIKANISIIASVENEIITNVDIKKEVEFLKIFNPQLNQLNLDQINNIAKNSLINEIIKKNEIVKFIDIDQDNKFLDTHMINFQKKLGYENLKKFKDDLIKKSQYSLNEIEKKIKIELFWNELIYSKYKNQLKIDKIKLLNKIKKSKNSIQKNFLLSEILFQKTNNQSIEDIEKTIRKSIEINGFNNTANIFSISESKKFGGKIGWVADNSLAKKILIELENLKIGETSNTVKIGNNYLILKIEDIEIIEPVINEEEELEKLIQVETNFQLNQFSRIYFDKSRINYLIDEK